MKIINHRIVTNKEQNTIYYPEAYIAFQCHTCQGPELGILCSSDKCKSGKLDEMPHMHTTDLFPIQADNLCFFFFGKGHSPP